FAQVLEISPRPQTSARLLRRAPRRRHHLVRRPQGHHCTSLRRRVDRMGHTLRPRSPGRGPGNAPRPTAWGALFRQPAGQLPSARQMKPPKTSASPAAFKAAFDRRFRDDPRARIIIMERFAARVCHEMDGAVIKGGLGLELRLETPRATKDADIIISGS